MTFAPTQPPLPRPEAASKDNPVPAEIRVELWSILRDARLCLAPQDEGAGSRLGWLLSLIWLGMLKSHRRYFAILAFLLLADSPGVGSGAAGPAGGDSQGGTISRAGAGASRRRRRLADAVVPHRRFPRRSLRSTPGPDPGAQGSDEAALELRQRFSAGRPRRPPFLPRPGGGAAKRRAPHARPQSVRHGRPARAHERGAQGSRRQVSRRRAAERGYDLCRRSPQLGAKPRPAEPNTTCCSTGSRRMASARSTFARRSRRRAPGDRSFTCTTRIGLRAARWRRSTPSSRRTAAPSGGSIRGPRSALRRPAREETSPGCSGKTRPKPSRT